MNIAVLDRPEGDFVCRACGAEFSRPAVKFDQLCDECWRVCDRWLRRMRVHARNRIAVNRWLARRLMIDAERVQRGGVWGRCEALTHDYGYGTANQCALSATTRRNGRRVCGTHHQTKQVAFVGVNHDPYITLQQLFIELATTDPKFRKCIEATARSVKTAEGTK